MSVICPACDARFRDPPAHVAASRPLQCGHCEHEWVRATVTAPPMVPDYGDLTDGERDGRALVTQDGVGQSRVTPIYVDAEPEEPARGNFPHRGLMAASVVAAFVFSGTILLRDVVIATAPQTVAFYETLGLAPDGHAGGESLSIANVTTTRTRKDGISQLIVRGEIENAADAVVPVPTLKLTMRGTADQTVYAWTAKAAADSLRAGESSTFTAVARDYPDAAVDVEVTFESATN